MHVLKIVLDSTGHITGIRKLEKFIFLKQSVLSDVSNKSLDEKG